MDGQGVPPESHRDKYFRDVTLTAEAIQELEWWEALLSSGAACQTAYSILGHTFTQTLGGW